MRKSIFALAVGGVLAATAFSASPASADHRWSPEFGWRTGHARPARVVITPDGREHFVPRRHRARTVIINPDGSRTIIRDRPRYRPMPQQQLVVVPRY